MPSLWLSIILDLENALVPGLKPRLKNHFRAHQLSVWLRLIPELHRAGVEDVVGRHNMFRNHHDPAQYDGQVRGPPGPAPGAGTSLPIEIALVSISIFFVSSLASAFASMK